MLVSTALYPDSEMPHGTPRLFPYSICFCTIALCVWSSRVFSYDGATSIGMRYSNIEPLHDNNIGVLPAFVNCRPNENQLSCGNLPCAIPVNVVSLASDASKS